MIPKSIICKGKKSESQTSCSAFIAAFVTSSQGHPLGRRLGGLQSKLERIREFQEAPSTIGQLDHILFKKTAVY